MSTYFIESFGVVKRVGFILVRNCNRTRVQSYNPNSVILEYFHINTSSNSSIDTFRSRGPSPKMSKAAKEAMAANYKSLKEDFVSGLTGGSISEINVVTAVAPVCLSFAILHEAYVANDAGR